jgi:signal peptidase
MRNTIKRVWNVVTTVLVGLMVILAALLWGFRLLGFEVLVVQSGSMEPDYPTGSIIYIQDVDPAELKQWDVITYQLTDTTLSTHRIIEIVDVDGQTMFRTKGDANDSPDEGYVAPSQVVGKPLFAIPYLGFFVAELQTTRGTYAAISTGAVLLLFLILPDLLFGEDEDKKKAKVGMPKPEEQVNISGEIPEENGGTL